MSFPHLADYCFEMGADEITAFAPDDRHDLVVDTFFRTVLPMALQVHGYEVLHASAVALGDRVIAFSAPSGTGKSTVASQFAERGARLWADDALLLTTAGPISTTALPFRMRLKGAAAGRFGVEVPRCWQNRQSSQEPERLPLQAAFFLLRDAQPGLHVERLTGTRAFEKLLNNAYCYSPPSSARKRRMIRGYLRVAAEVPLFEIRFQSGLDLLPAVMDNIREIAEGLA